MVLAQSPVEDIGATGRGNRDVIRGGWKGFVGEETSVWGNLKGRTVSIEGVKHIYHALYVFSREHAKESHYTCTGCSTSSAYFAVGGVRLPCL